MAVRPTYSTLTPTRTSNTALTFPARVFHTPVTSMLGLMPTMPTSPRRGRFYYDLIVFQVQGLLQRVPRYGFEKWSTRYETLFPVDDPNGIGKEDDHPILLDDVKNIDFESIVEVLYPTSPFEPVELSTTRWLGVLSLATRWSMPKIREVAIKKISADWSLSPFEKLENAQKCKVTTWFIEGCEAITKDFHQIKSIEELASQLGWEDAARIAWIAAQNPSLEMAGKMITVPFQRLRCPQCKLPDQLEGNRSGSHDVRSKAPIYCRGCMVYGSEVMIGVFDLKAAGLQIGDEDAAREKIRLDIARAFDDKMNLMTEYGEFF